MCFSILFSKAFRRRRAARRRSKVFLACFVGLFLAGACSRVSAAEGMGVEVDLRRLNEDASAATRANDYVRVEQLRLARLALLRAYAKSGKEVSESLGPWINGVEALDTVDGISAALAFLAPPLEAKPGLIDRCKYKEAFETLELAWRGFESTRGDGEGAVLGEIAVRMFEVAQQAMAVNWGVDDPSSTNYITSRSSLQKILEEARRRDPCAVICIPMLQHLIPPDPTEAFLTADVRTDFKARQSALLAMSHPLVEVNAALSPRATDWPVLPLHAASELLKAENLFSILRDLELTRPLVRDLPLSGDNSPSYVVPGTIEDFVDRNGERLQLLYGRMFVLMKADVKGRRRPCVLYLDTTARRPKWKKLYMNVLIYRPKNESYPAGIRKLLEGQVPLREIDLNDSRLALYDYPVELTKKFLGEGLHILRVKDAYELIAADFKPLRNDPAFVERLLSKPGKEVVQTSPRLANEIKVRAAEGNRDRHALVDLFENVPIIKGMNALLLVSDDDRTPSEPDWFSDEQESNPTLKTIDGRTLRIFATADGGEGFFYELEQPGGNVFFPVTWSGVPDSVIASGAKAQDHIAKARAAGLNVTDLVADLKKLYAGELRKPSRAITAFAKGMSSGGDGKGDTGFVPEAAKLFEVYGFRHLRDSRGNLILHKEYVDANRDNSQANVASGVSQLQYAYAVRTPDGLTSIMKPQVYDWEDYKNIKRNIVIEHLSRVASLHPCLDAVSTLAAYARAPLVNPSEKPPAWLGDESIVVGPNVSQDTKGGVVDFADYRDHFVQPKSFVSLDRMRSVIGDRAKPSVVEALNRLALVYQTLWVEMPDQYWCLKHQRPTGSECTRCKADNDNRDKDGPGPLPESQTVQQNRFFIDWIGGVDTSDPAVKRGQFSFDTDKYRRLNDYYFYEQTNAEKLQESREFVVRGLLIDTARYFARNGRHHYAIVHYNDALEVLDSGLPFYPTSSQVANWRDLSLLGQVPDAAAARAFAGELRRIFIAERAALTLQLELAGVLMSAGKTASALRMFSHVALTAEFYINPLVDIAMDFFTAYGINADDELQGVVREIQEVFRVAEAAFRRCGGDEKFYASGVNDLTRPHELGEILQRLDDVAEADVGPRSDQRNAELAGATRTLRDLMGRLPFEDWVRVQRRVSQLGVPIHCGNTETVIDPVARTPLVFDEEMQRFVHCGTAALFQRAGEAYGEFKAKAGQWTPTTREDAHLCYLFGAYWLCRGEATKARLAFAAASRVFSQVGARIEQAESRLVAEMNAFWCLVVMESVQGKHDGLRRIGLDFVDGLRGQLFAWSRRWFAAGLPGPAASQQVEFVEYSLRILARRAEDNERVRWFFPDYRSEVGGPIPDSFLLKFFQQRSLEEIEADNAAIVSKTLKIAKLEADAAKNKEKNGEQVAQGNGEPTLADRIKSLQQEIDELKGKNLAAIDAVLADAVEKYRVIGDIKLEEDIVLGDL